MELMKSVEGVGHVTGRINDDSIRGVKSLEFLGGGRTRRCVVNRLSVIET